MDWTLFFTYFAACAAAATSGAMIQPGPWYDALNKPTWTPPNWVFPVVWTSLYVLMSLAGMRAAQATGSGLATALWSVQIALNTLWTPVYFGLHRIRAALVVIGFLWLAVAATTVALFGVDWVAGLMFVPYLIWVSIAAFLNYTTVRLNPASA